MASMIEGCSVCGSRFDVPFRYQRMNGEGHREAPSQGKTLLEYASDARAAQDYERVVDYLESGARAKQAGEAALLINEALAG